MDPFLELPPLPRPNAPDSPTSSSDKENATSQPSGPSRNQRVCDIVREFDKIAGQCESWCQHSQNSNENQKFDRFGFRNASLRVMHTNYGVVQKQHPAPPPQSMSSSGSLTDLSHSGRLDRVTLLEATIKDATGDLKRPVDVLDAFVCARQQLRLENRYADLQRQRATVDVQLGGKRTAIIDKRARSCMQTADRLAQQLRERIDVLRVLGEMAKRWDELVNPLDDWLNRFRVELDRARRTPNELVVKALVDEWQTHEPQWWDLRDLVETLTKGHEEEDQTKFRTEFGQFSDRWIETQNSLFALKHAFDVANQRDDLSIALDQLDEMLDSQRQPSHVLKSGDYVDGGAGLSSPNQQRHELEVVATRVDDLWRQLKDEKAETVELSAKRERLAAKQRRLDDENGRPSVEPASRSPPVRYDCASSHSLGSSSDTRSIPVSSVHSSRFQSAPDPLMGINELLQTLRNFNRIRYSAYRTGMKLFALQKRLRLDLVELADLDRQFRLLPPGIVRLPWESLFTILRHCYENAHLRYPRSVADVQMAIQTCTDLLRQLSPALETRVLQTALVVLCSARVEDKYRYLYRIYASADETRATAADLKSLLGNLARLPHLIEEDRTFGNATVEPSVGNCIRSAYASATAFLSTTPPSTLTETQFMEWVRQDPQTLVWIRVMHRLVASEYVKHNARCAACKMQPIVGIRFRCLVCFNVDFCQTCFFVQRPSKGHKTTHEMHEYYMPTNTLDNMRDFTQIVHNKMRRSKSSNKIGYTPVDLNSTLPGGHPTRQLSTPTTTTDSAAKPPPSNGMITRMLQRTGEVDIDELIEQARRDGRLPSSPTHAPTADELSDLIQILWRENRQLHCAYQLKVLNGRTGILTSPSALPPALVENESKRRLDEAVDCLRVVADSADRRGRK